MAKVLLGTCKGLTYKKVKGEGDVTRLIYCTVLEWLNKVASLSITITFKI